MYAKTQAFFGPKALFQALFSGSKFSHLLTVTTEGAEPLAPAPYGQPDRKISVFLDDWPSKGLEFSAAPHH